MWVQAAKLIKSMHLRILESSGLHATLQPHRPFAKQKNQSIGHAPTLGPCYETTGIAQHLKYPVRDRPISSILVAEVIPAVSAATECKLLSASRQLTRCFVQR